MIKNNNITCSETKAIVFTINKWWFRFQIMINKIN